MITTNDDKVADATRILRQHGMRRRYYHDDLGFNFRMTDIHAAIGLEQLKKLPEFNRKRQANAKYFNEHITGVVTPLTPDGYEHVFHQYTIRVPDGKRDAMVDYLNVNGVGSGIYYPVPVHQQTLYTQDLGYDQTLPQAEKAASEVLSLPVHPALSDADLKKIVTTVNNFVAEYLD
jgi:dTDP-4-amino-4,6-dideoxygalactose transaminase